MIVAFADSGNLIGGSNPGEGNVISGNPGDGVQLRDFGTNNNTVQGNFIGTNVAGDLDYGNGGNGVLSGTVGNIIGGDISTAGNLISGNNTHGILLSGATTNTVQGNIIGLNGAGNTALRNEGNGITMNGGGTHQIGGSTLSLRNVISGNNNSGTTADGIYIPGSSNNIIHGNYIGSDLGGTVAIGNYSAGIACDGNNNQIGGTLSGQGNLIMGNGSFGIRVGAANSGNEIRQNSMRDNGGLGIDLNGNNVTPNDLNDTDGGANGLLNFPVLETAIVDGGMLTLSGSGQTRKCD